MSKEYPPTPQPWPLNREVLPHVTVTLNPPPCERSFRLWYAPDGELASVEIDGVYYSTRRLKRSIGAQPGSRCLAIVEVLVRLPEDAPPAA